MAAASSSLLYQVAYCVREPLCGRYVVTLSVDQVTFREPIHVGELVDFLATVNYAGTSSMEVGIKVIAQNIHAQIARHVNSCFFTMVAVGDDRKPVAVPPLALMTADEKRRFEAAKLRRKLRAELHERFHETMHSGS